jgi:predicted peptidase
MSLMVEPFDYHRDFEVHCKSFHFTKADISEVKTEIADDFTACEKYDVRYRLHEPSCKGMRPLLLFLHGGGEIGYDNWNQLVNTFGATEWAKRYPDIYVMAPQAPGKFDSDKIGTKSFLKDVNYMPFERPFDSSSTNGFGWNREYLSNVCTIIREMIKDGKVDGKRVYVTGLSMGGAGTLRALAVDRSLFAAAAPVCPTMNPETFAIMKGLGDFKIWISTAYVDFTYSRHKYIVDGIMYLRDQGSRNARLTLYSHEELAKYGLGSNYDLTVDERMIENHQSWVLTYHNEYGIMDWLLTQEKE